MSEEKHIDIDYTAKLARINLTDAEKEKLSAQLDSIIGYVEKLEELDTDGVEPTAHPHPVYNVWQEDQVQEGLSIEEALKNAPAQRDNMIVVPKVVD
ncbi:Asp-tRNA(Asn)/Glu-tRNA(Gln) amidotransferase subunit GatC [Pelagicoccus sp. SDUM812005]|uniref:Asp-tRNA(Asn)/Glu-tRNA(Gln) amidotransferase subunit GatC n=1 Tax=Pelagicoccus sp. SDUM812005 TaxID=3041257 RepID=UPI00280F3C8D|nr:Asp-tRNA(Asn)/Glu-tRNA(Gln) amidotransferase subunit GatC [Pelagicoccus sp. SDUM812005]MDQ8179824.1 Asp-tRNA(Asn)/Glu-tRNA(Gln) amidotransferase subunit GatC [Pelagicoccus sp. SDUM812005]